MLGGAEGIDPSCKCRLSIWAMRFQRPISLHSACKPSSLAFSPQIFFCGAGLSLIEVFPMCLLKGNHHQDICKVSRLWSTHRNSAKRNAVTLSLLGGWKDSVSGVRAAGGESRVLAPPEMKGSSFFSHLRQGLFHFFPPRGWKLEALIQKKFWCECAFKV